MTAPLKKSHSRRFSKLELAIVISMVAVLAGFAITALVSGNAKSSRTQSTLEIANQLQRARLDSIRRNASDIKQMAQVKIFNRRFYSITIDGDNDGYLDVPLVLALPEGPGMEISGPFPKTYIFDSHGKNVDSQGHRLPSPDLVIGNSSGASAVKLAEDGTISVLPAVKLTAAK